LLFNVMSLELRPLNWVLKVGLYITQIGLFLQVDIRAEFVI
jgi:hypothetical protein